MKTQTTPPRIARNKPEFENALFTGPSTFSGYVERVLKNGGIKLHFMSETYVLNTDHVFCLATRMDDGRTWYSYGGELNRSFTMSTLADLETNIRALI